MKTASRFAARALLVAALGLTAIPAVAQEENATEQPLQYALDVIEGLPADAPREGTVITVDVSTNQMYLFRDGQLVRKTLVGTGSDKKLRKGSKIWWFRTPRGRYEVLRRIPDPVWRKPDWAFIEEGKRVPPPDSPKRLVKNKLGRYALDLGDGILIHGTDDPNSFGRKVSHGCIRTPDDMLEFLWKEVNVGTKVMIFDSQPMQLAGSEKGLNDLEMLD